LKRLMARDGRSEADARARIDAQMSIEEKRRRADRVIDNGGPPSETRRQVAEIYEWLRDRGASRSEGNSS
jgi:dephospho-CoA kinase